MKITRDNYEPYFIDYLDGNLDQGILKELLDFIQQNPDLKEELQLIDNFKVEAEEVLFENREKLFKDKYDQTEVFDQTAIASLEGDLTESEKAEFEEYLIKHPHKRKELFVFEKTKLQPDPNILFRHKDRLYNYPARKVLLLWMPRVAAILIIGLLAYLAYDYTGTDNYLKQHPVEVSEQIDQKPDKTPASEPAKVPHNPQFLSDDKLFVDNLLDKGSNEAESSNNKIQEEDKVVSEPVNRVKTEVPELIQSRSAMISGESLLTASLAPVAVNQMDIPASEPEEILLGEVVREKTGLKNLSIENVAKAGLSLVSAITKDKVSYEINNNGQINELSFETRLLAFSIPAGSD